MQWDFASASLRGRALAALAQVFHLRDWSSL